MYLALTDEQSFLQEAARDALARHKTVEAARAALDGEAYPSLWDAGAQAGWPGLLTGEDADGVGLGAYEALLVLEVGGRTLADARLLGHLPAMALLELAGADAGVRAPLARGERRAALVDGQAGDRPGAISIRDGAASGGVTGVLDAAGADVLVVVSGDDLIVVETTAEGVTVTPKPAYDGTRALADVVLRGAPGIRLTVPDGRGADGRDLQRALLAAEAVGAADAAMTMARDYAIDRVAFGRPIGSYQAIKHKIVEMLRLVEGARSLLVAAGEAWTHDRDGFGLAANAARVAATDALSYATPENIFIHGGVGATWEHDASLFYRRAESSRRLCGGHDEACAAVADALLAAA